MIDSIDSDVTRAGEKFLASLDDPLVVDEKIVVERGADVTVQVVRVEQSGKFAGRDEVALKLFDITIGGIKYAVASSYAEVASGSRGKRTAKVVGGTAALAPAQRCRLPPAASGSRFPPNPAWTSHSPNRSL